MAVDGGNILFMNCKCKKCDWSWVIESNDSHPYLCHKCGYDNKLNKYDKEELNKWKMENPYKQMEINEDSFIRIFESSVESNELVWHRDREDRMVEILEENDWKFQFDNELPITLKLNETIMIPKNTYHRVIKGTTDLKVKITEVEFEFETDILNEAKKKKKKDACYHKVRSRYSVWPSAYASGALVKCRKVGAANWGNKSNESEEPIEEKWSEKYKRSIDCNNPKGFSQKAHCQGRKKTDESNDNLDELTVHEAKKTDFSKEKESGLHGWFARQGGSGKSKGWVDCNTCKKDPKTGRKKCKSCGRKDGEDRSYPACRPTASACGTRGKGKKWGKKSNESLDISENNGIFDKNYIKNMIKETFSHDDEPAVKPAPVKEPSIKPDTTKPDRITRRKRTFSPVRETQPDPKAKK